MITPVPYGILANRHAGLSRDPRWLQTVVKYAARHKDLIKLYLPHDVDFVRSALLRLVNVYNVDLIFIHGGDGTLQLATNALINEHEQGRIKKIPVLCPLSGGTMVAVGAGWLGWKEAPIKTLKKVIARKEDLPLRKCRPLKISFTNREGVVETCYGFMFILGPIARVIRLYDEQGRSHINGIKTMILGALGAITGHPRKYADMMTQFDARIVADGQELPLKRPISIISSITDSLIFGIKPYGGHAESNQFYTISYELPGWAAASLVPLAYRGTVVLEGSSFLNRPVCRMQMTSQETMIMLDGEFFDMTPGKPVDLELGPEIELVAAF